MRMVIVAWLMVLLGVPAAAQAYDEAKPEIPTLTVTGSGHLAVALDTAFVIFGMKTAGKSVAEAQRQNNQVMSKVMERLRELQIEKERI